MPDASPWTGLGVPRFAFERGLHDLGNNSFAWLQPDGGWGWSNAGLIVSGDESLLVDTLFDLPNTREMLDAMKKAHTAAADIDRLVNTHSNGDHTHGNELVAGAEIVASATAAAEMEATTPEALAALMRGARENGGLVGDFLVECFGSFDFEGITHTLPNRTFDGQLTLMVGDKRVELTEVGPAHTGGDIMVHIPDDRTVFTGDILFIEGAPIIWAGPVQNWIDACDLLLSWDLETIVPGHGPITDNRGVEAMRAYLVYIRDEARKRYDAGLSARDAALDIALGDFASWGDSERIAINVDSLYREFSGSGGDRTHVQELFTRMAELAQDRRR